MTIAVGLALVIGLVVCGICIWGAYNDWHDAEQYKCDTNELE
jgi:hypothetical protein